jgi:hypothetical protein
MTAKPANVRFLDLLKLAKDNFGEPRICGSHHIFKMPWHGNPRVNLQKDGKDAKPYQVKQLNEALAKLKSWNGGSYVEK